MDETEIFIRSVIKKLKPDILNAYEYQYGTTTVIAMHPVGETKPWSRTSVFPWPINIWFIPGRILALWPQPSSCSNKKQDLFSPFDWTVARPSLMPQAAQLWSTKRGICEAAGLIFRKRFAQITLSEERLENRLDLNKSDNRLSWLLQRT